MRPETPRDAARKSPKPRRRGRKPQSFRPSWDRPPEVLEARIVLSTDTWTGGGVTAAFSDMANWSGDGAPATGDTLVFPPISGLSSGAHTAPTVDVSTHFAEVDIQDAGYTIGGSTTLSTDSIVTGYASNKSTIADAVTLGNDQTSTPGHGVIQAALGGTLEISGVVGGSSGLTLQNGGTVQLDGAADNTYTGTTTVDAGTLALVSVGHRAAPGDLVVGDGIHAATVVYGAAAQTGTIATPANLTVNALGTLNLNSFGDVIGNLTLSGGSVQTGTGTLQVSNGDTIYAYGGGTSAITGNLQLGSGTGFDVASGSILALGAVVSGSNGLTVAGGGELLMDGTAPNTYTGTTTVNQAALVLDATGGGAIPGALIVGDGLDAAIVQDAQPAQLGSGMGVTIKNGGTLDLNGHNDSVGALNLTNGATVTSGVGTLTLDGNVTEDSVAGAASISGNVAMPATVTFTVDTPSVLLSLSAQVSGVGGLTLAGGGTLLLTGGTANTFTGTATVDNGLLSLDKLGEAENGITAVPGALVIGDGTHAAEVDDQASEQISTTSLVTVNPLGKLNLGASNDNAGGLTVYVGSDVETGTGTLSLFGPVKDPDPSGGVYINGHFDLAAAVDVTVAPSASLNVDGPISGEFGLTLDGGGDLAYQGNSANTYSGMTVVTSGSLDLEKGGAIALPGNATVGGDALNTAAIVDLASHQFSGSGTMTVGINGTLNLNNHNESVGVLNLTSSVDVTPAGADVTTGNGTLTVSGGSIFEGSPAGGSAYISGHLALTVPTTFSIQSISTLNLSAVVSGTTGLALNGGTLLLDGSNNNTYTGVTTVNSGTLELNSNAYAVPGDLVVGDGTDAATVVYGQDYQVGTGDTDSNVTVNALGTFNLNGHADIIHNLTLSNGGLVETGVGTLEVDSTGTITSGGGAAPSVINGNLLLDADTTFNASTGSELDLGAVVSGSAAVTLAGGGQLKMDGTAPNTYTGTTTVKQGALVLDATGGGAIPGALVIGDGTDFASVQDEQPAQLGSGMGVTIKNGGTLDLNGHNDSVGPLGLTAGAAIGTGAGTLTLDGAVTQDNAAGYAQIDGNVALPRTTTFTINPQATFYAFATFGGAGGLTVNGGGSFDMLGSSSNTYAGTTTIDSGTLVLRQGATTSIPGNLVVGDGTHAAYVQDYSSSSIVPGSLVTVNNLGNLDLGGDNETVAGLTVHAGSTVDTQGGTLTLGGPVTDPDTTGAAALNGHLALPAGTAAFQVATGGAIDLNGDMTGAGGLTLAGGGTLAETGSTSNTYTGTTTVDAGTLSLNKGSLVGVPGALVIGDGTDPATVSDLAGGAFSSLTDVTIRAQGVLNLAGIDPDPIHDLTLDGGTANVAGSTLLQVEGDVVSASQAGTTSSINGPLELSGPSTRFNITAPNSVTVDGLISGGQMVLDGGGTLTLSGSSSGNIFSGTRVDAGTLVLDNSPNTDSAPGTLTIGDGTHAANVLLVAPGQLDSDATVQVNAGGTLNLDGNNQQVGSLTFDGGAVATGTGTLTLSGVVNVATNAVAASITGKVGLLGLVSFQGPGTLDIPANVADASVINNGAAAPDVPSVDGVVLNGGAVVHLSGQNSYDGPTHLVDGFLAVESPGGLGATSGVTVDAGSTAWLDGGVLASTVPFTLGSTGFNPALGGLVVYPGAVSIGSLTLDGSSIVTVGPGSSLSVGDLHTDGTSHALIVTGPGLLAVDATGVVAIPATVVGATLDVAGTLGGGVTLLQGGTLDGNGTVGVVTSAGGTVGDYNATSPMSLTAGALTLDPSSTFKVVIASGASYDRLVAQGPVTIGGASLSLSLNGYVPAIGDWFTLIRGTQGVVGAFAGLADGAYLAVNNVLFQVHYAANQGGGTDVILHYAQPSTTTLTASASQAVAGQPITFTATVVAPSGLPTGSVTFQVDGMAVATVAVNNLGKAAFSIASMTPGPHTITASYGGDPNFQASTSTGLAQVVVKAPTTATLSQSSAASVAGQPITFTATIAPVAPGAGMPTGLVVFKDGATVLGTATMVNGTARLTVSSLSVGPHGITMSYAGDGSFAAVAAPPTITQAVSQAGSTTTLATTQSPITYGQSTTFTARATANAPSGAVATGLVAFLDGSTMLAVVPMVNGSASYSAHLSAGTHAITAVFGGDNNLIKSTSTALGQVVVGASTYGLLSASTMTPVFGQPVTYTGAVYPFAPGQGTPTGTLTFFDGTTQLGTAALVGGQASLTAPAGEVGQHGIRAVYSGDANFGKDSSLVLSVPVGLADASVKVSIQAVGPLFLVPAYVIPTAPGVGVATGTVTLLANNQPVATATLTNGASGQLTIPAGTAAGKVLTVRYSGDAHFRGSTSYPFTSGAASAKQTTSVMTRTFSFLGS